jgi:hypothetical protein
MCSTENTLCGIPFLQDNYLGLSVDANLHGISGIVEFIVILRESFEEISMKMQAFRFRVVRIDAVRHKTQISDRFRSVSLALDSLSIRARSAAVFVSPPVWPTSRRRTNGPAE